MRGWRLSPPITHRIATAEPRFADSSATIKGPDVRHLGLTGTTRGAACQNRTDDLLITSEMLYRLS